MIPAVHSVHTWVCRYGYSSACAAGIVLAVRRTVLEQQQDEPRRKVQIYSVCYTLSCALEIGLEFKLFPNLKIASLVSNGAYFGGAVIRFGVEEERVGKATCVMDMANAVVYVGIGPNKLSMALTVLSPALGFWPQARSRIPYLPI